MRTYGCPYQGSKNVIAEDIIGFLPSGKRLVDLFGGGGAISHCAVLSDKWKSVLYNDYDNITYRYFKNAYEGEYSKPKYLEPVTREMFTKMKTQEDPYCFACSFGNNYISYIYGKNIEKDRLTGERFIVCADNKEDMKQIVPKELWYMLDDMENITDITERRLALYKIVKQTKKNFRGYERLKQLERLQRLQRLQRLERLEFSNISYTEYQYKDGDIVYCDIPYENTRNYSSNKTKFNHEQFYEWVLTRPYQVFFSSYEISNNRFYKVWEKTRRSTFSATNNKLLKQECIYSNRI